MNGRKKLLCLLMLAFFLFSYTSLNAFAAPVSGSSSAASSKPVDNPVDNPTDKPVDNPADKPADKPVVKQPEPTTTPKATSSKPKRRYTSSSSSSSSSMSSVPDFFGFSSSQASSQIVLPSADSVVEFDPLASATSGNPSNKMKQIGILAWVCILLGVAVVLIVILSNRRPPRGPGRSRYHRTKRSKKKRLLSDKYYRGLNRY